MDIVKVQTSSQLDNSIYLSVKYDEVMKLDLNNSYIYRFDGVPHSAFDNATPCALPMLLQFLDDPSKAADLITKGHIEKFEVTRHSPTDYSILLPLTGNSVP